MKKLTLLLGLLIFTIALRAQTVHMTTSYKQTCYWNQTTLKFDQCGDNGEYASMFTLNADETIFDHTTSDMKSSYYVSKRQYDAEYDEYEYDVTSDVGNKYTFLVDLKNNELRILSSGHDDSGDDYLITYTLKSSWKD